MGHIGTACWASVDVVARSFLPGVGTWTTFEETHIALIGVASAEYLVFVILFLSFDLKKRHSCLHEIAAIVVIDWPG